MKIIAAVDRSDYADRVIDFTRRLAEGRQAEVLLIQVAPREPDVFGQQLVRKVITDPVPEELRDRRELLDRCAAALDAAGVDCETLMIRGRPAPTIVREAERWGAEVIVIGSQGRDMLYRKTLGSVSEEVVRSAGLPVLVVPLRERAD
ncbi:universal stress protein [Lentisalinibacter orientalis]|uniref:universal stress protein n=1 Tax=Lentisalinibacter orientalis TaxID=2992241 RepID=UPI003865D038